MTSSPVRRRLRGFTLLEMLVVLVLTGAITAILMQALSHVFALQTHFGIELFNLQQGEMYSEWFRESVNGLLPDRAEGKNRFKGEQRRFAGLTLAPLNAATDALQPFTWRLAFEPGSGRTQLRYGDQDDAPVVLSWPGESGQFVYIDDDNQPHDSWPPFLGKWPQLPKAINLEYRGVDGTQVIVAAPKGLEEPLPSRQDLES